jgi:hypothetical protein
MGAAFQAQSADHPLSWIAGQWCGQSDGTLIEETWLPPTSKLMLGVNRNIVDQKTVSFEYLRIIVDDHGQSHYVAQPGGRPATSFALVESGPNWARFENPDHDFPKWIAYQRQDKALTARIGGPGENGSEVEMRHSPGPFGSGIGRKANLPVGISIEQAWIAHDLLPLCEFDPR